MRRLVCACSARFGALAPSLAGVVRARAFHATRAALADARKDPYSVLGVPKDAGKEDVKKAYYKLVKKCVFFLGGGVLWHGAGARRGA